MKIFAAVTFCFLAMLASCENSIEQTDFIIRVTKIDAPDKVKLGESLSARIFGIIGADGCHVLKKADLHIAGNIGHATFYGEKVEGPCTMSTSYLRQDNHMGYDISFTPQSRGLFIISVRQPDNTLFKDTVIVE
ncbi:MAG TPA: hypothetical protein VEC36_01915 [Patescibacteria group bacterium]|nr:hypothetical protein [Patescibacteria group bacterium]